MPYELDGLRLRVTVTGGTVDDPLPVAFAWASAIAARVTRPQVTPAQTVAGTATPDGLEVLSVWAANALPAGVWLVQVRAGATEGAARTIHEEHITVSPSLVAS